MDQDVLSVKRFSHRVMSVWLRFDRHVLNVISIYATQKGLDEKSKNKFYDYLHEIMNSIAKNELLTVGGDFNGSVGETAYGHPNLHSGHGYSLENNEEIRLLDFSECHQFTVCNTFFKKQPDHLVTYSSEGNQSQID